MKKKVKFERWTDPLNSNVVENEWPGFNVDEDGEAQPIYASKMTQVMHTPFGALSMLTNTVAANQFEFWWMHTNFDITNEIRDVIKVVPGVETLEITTRYRARIGFPKSGFFAGNQVMHDIQEAVTAIDHAKQNQALIGLPNNIAYSVIEMRDKVDAKYDNWALLVLPNGSIEVLTSDKIDTTYTSKLELFNAAKSLIGGRLLTSEV
jgi:hypothetical protein